jgi:predicted 3-demethylubiquinone-9 3-methyltransferase (glyoxalase superfamily)
MQKIKPCIWFDSNAEKAVDFYVSIFKGSKIKQVAHYDDASSRASGQPKGSVLTVDFMLEGQEFMALNGGPVFKPSPAISFSVSCKTVKELDALWAKLSDRATIMLPLEKYPFSERYGFLTDRFGVSWQLNLAKSNQKIRISLIFVGKMRGKAEEAIGYYTSLFRNSGLKAINRFAPGETESGATLRYSEFTLEGIDFIAMESTEEHPFTFTPGISLMVSCQDQKEIDTFWDKLSKGGRKDQCGWLTDRYGVSWQVVPSILGELMEAKDPVKAGRVTEALMKMTKLNIAVLKEAYGKK